MKRRSLIVLILLLIGIFAFVGSSWLLLKIVRPAKPALIKKPTKPLVKLSTPLGEEYTHVLEAIEPDTTVAPEKIAAITEQISTASPEEKKEIYQVTDNALEQLEKEIADDAQQGGENLPAYAEHFEPFRPLFDELEGQPYNTDYDPYAHNIGNRVRSIDDHFNNFGYERPYYPPVKSRHQPTMPPSVKPSVPSSGGGSTIKPEKEESISRKPKEKEEKQKKEKTKKERLEKEQKKRPEKQELSETEPPSNVSPEVQTVADQAQEIGEKLQEALDNVLKSEQKIAQIVGELVKQAEVPPAIEQLTKEIAALEGQKTSTDPQNAVTLDLKIDQLTRKLVEQQSGAQKKISSLINHMHEQQDEQISHFEKIAHLFKEVRIAIPQNLAQLFAQAEPAASQALARTYQTNIIKVADVVQFINLKAQQDLAALELHAKEPFLAPGFLKNLKNIYKLFNEIVGDADAILQQFSQASQGKALVAKAIDPRLLHDLANLIKKVEKSLAQAEQAAEKQKEQQAQPLTREFVERAGQLLDKFNTTIITAFENAQKRQGRIQLTDLTAIRDSSKDMLELLNSIGIQEHIKNQDILMPLSLAQKYQEQFLNSVVPCAAGLEQSIQKLLELQETDVVPYKLSCQIIQYFIALATIFNQIPVEKEEVDITLPDEIMQVLSTLHEQLTAIALSVSNKQVQQKQGGGLWSLIFGKSIEQQKAELEEKEELEAKEFKQRLENIVEGGLKIKLPDVPSKQPPVNIIELPEEQKEEPAENPAEPLPQPGWFGGLIEGAHVESNAAIADITEHLATFGETARNIWQPDSADIKLNQLMQLAQQIKNLFNFLEIPEYKNSLTEGTAPIPIVFANNYRRHFIDYINQLRTTIEQTASKKQKVFQAKKASNADISNNLRWAKSARNVLQEAMKVVDLIDTIDQSRIEQLGVQPPIAIALSQEEHALFENSINILSDFIADLEAQSKK